MLTQRTATGLTIAVLALPATATAQVQPNPDNRSAAAPAVAVPAVSAIPPVQSNPDNRAAMVVGQDLRSPDAIDAARSGQITQQLRHYRAQPPGVAEEPAPSHGPDWPPIAFGAVVLFTAALWFIATRVRARRSSRVTA
jgi:hypothetical protein